MTERERTDEGTYAETVTPEGVLGVFDAVEGPVITSSDVADVLDCTTEAARRKLRRLVDRKTLAYRKTGRTNVYWRTDADDEPAVDAGTEPAGERAEPVPKRAGETTLDVGETGDDAGPTAGDVKADLGEYEPDADGQPASDSDTGDAEIDDALDGWRPGQSLDRREQRRDAGRAALHFLKNRGVASASEFREYVEPDNPVDGQSPDTWWRKTARPALKRAQEAGLVAFDDGEKAYRWSGET